MKKIIIALLGIILFLTPSLVCKANIEKDKNKDKKEIEEVQEKKGIILIDPGHGGIDGGASSKNGTIEKELNLEISLKLRDLLEDNGYEVYMTRETDEGLYSEGKTVREKKREDLNKRVALKSETKCNIFISIHQNVFQDVRCFGAQVWHASNENSKMLADNIQNSLRMSVDDSNNRVAKSAGNDYVILRDGYEGASIILECGFLSNPEEESKLKSEEHQENIIQGILSGIDEYFEEFKEEKYDL